MRDMAEELLKLYAARKLAPGYAFSADSNWQREFEDAFEFTETRDQKAAIADIKRDMESPQPMDRLLCGDVGYGKTEVVMRAAFKAMGDGRAGRRAVAHHRALLPAFQYVQETVSAVPGAHRNAQPVSFSPKRSRRCWKILPRAKSIWWSARTGCFRRTWCGKISGSSSSTKSSASASSTKSG